MRFTFRAAIVAALASVIAIARPDATPCVDAAEPAVALPTELQYVPHDAAFFLYADAAKIWSHDITKSLRKADKVTFASLAESTTKVMGMNIDDLKSVVVFLPKLKQEEDSRSVGFVLTFTKPFDKNTLTTGAAHLVGNDLMNLAVLAPTDKTAVVLFGLGEEYTKPRRKEETGPLSSAIKAAASGKHTLVAAVTVANLPEELLGDDIPGDLRMFQPFFRSESIAATLDLSNTLDLNVHVKTAREAQALDAEKALAQVVKLIFDGAEKKLKGELKSAGKELITVMNAGVGALKAAKYSVDGTAARLSASLPLKGLPLEIAYLQTAKFAQEEAARLQASNNMKQIVLACHSYAGSNNDLFPPAGVVGKNAKPLLSWRVLILPYIEHDALYKEFKLDEPWDSEHNKKLLVHMPKTYAIPGVTKPGDTNTHFRVFVGNGAAFDWLASMNLNNNVDGTSNTLACVTAATAVPWTKPEELDFDPNKDMGKLLGFLVNGKAIISLCDGSVLTLTKAPKKENLNALITHSGGEVLPQDFLCR